MSVGALRVLVVDDHPLVRFALRELLERELHQARIGEAGDGADALRSLQAETWDAMILDMSLGNDDGLQVLREARRYCPSVPVLILSMHPPSRFADQALEAGAAAYLTKAEGLDHLVETVERICPGCARGEAGAEGPARRPALHDTLSVRELQVLRHLAAGRRASEIAVTLGIGVKTVGTYRQRMLDKLHLRTTAAVIRYAVEHRLLDE
jgi:two-component system invasion response regulator UvrY